jgi:hypothetical protein
MILLCPLEFERRALRKVARELGWALECTGPGMGAANWIHRHARGGAASAALGAHDFNRGARPVVILAGVAAGLVAPAVAGSAWVAGAVICLRGAPHAEAVGEPDAAETLRPTWNIPFAPTATIASVDGILPDAAAKQRVAAATGASLADLESAHFARAAEAAGFQWAIVRGVSDDCNHTLPTGVELWTDSAGRTRLTAVLASTLARPTSLPALIRTGKFSRRAMRSVAALLRNTHNAPFTATATPRNT